MKHMLKWAADTGGPEMVTTLVVNPSVWLGLATFTILLPPAMPGPPGGVFSKKVSTRTLSSVIDTAICPAAPNVEPSVDKEASPLN